MRKKTKKKMSASLQRPISFAREDSNHLSFRTRVVDPLLFQTVATFESAGGTWRKKFKMHRLSLRGDPTPEQEQKWTPDSMMESLLAMQEKPMSKV